MTTQKNYKNNSCFITKIGETTGFYPIMNHLAEGKENDIKRESKY